MATSSTPSRTTIYADAMHAAMAATEQQSSPIFLRHAKLREVDKQTGAAKPLSEKDINLRTVARVFEVKYQKALVEELTGKTGEPDAHGSAVVYDREAEGSALERRMKREFAARELINAYMEAGHSEPDAKKVFALFDNTLRDAIRNVTGISKA